MENEEITSYNTLYKRTETGATQLWWQQRQGNKWRTVSGQMFGKMVTSGWHECFSTNEGKANYRDGPAQADFEVKANYKKQLKSYYFENIADIDKSQYFEPMLAQNWDDRAAKVKFPVFCQAKLDGIRCIATREGLFTRNGEPIVSCPHIHHQLLDNGYFEEFEILDGELYNHSLHDDFNEISSIIRQSKPTPEDLMKSRQFAQYWIYDVKRTRDSQESFKDRYGAFLALHQDLFPDNVFSVGYQVADSVEKLNDNYEFYLDQNFEGQMVRDPNAPYENKRSKYLLKRKVFQTAEFKVLSIIEGLGNRGGMAGNVFVEIPGLEKPCSSGIKGTHAFCRKLLEEKNEYIGGDATIRFFGYTPDGMLRFPVMVDIVKGKRKD